MDHALRAISRAVTATIVLCWVLLPASAGTDAEAPRRPGRPEPRLRSVVGPTQQAPAATDTTRSTLATSGPVVIPGAEGAKEIGMDFYGLDIDHFIRILSTQAGVTIIKDEEVTGPVTVISPAKVSVEEAFQIFNSVLQVRGYTMIRSATGVYKVVPIPDAVQSGLEPRFGNRPEDVPASDDLITQVIRLENVPAGDAASQIQGMLSENASVTPTSTNMLIISDSAANIRSALTIIADLEDQLSGGFTVFELHYYDATEMAELVDSLILGRGGGAGAGPRPGYEARVRTAAQRRTPARPTRPQPQAAAGAGPEFCYPNVRTNSLIVLATPLHLRQMDELIQHLDRPVSLRDTYLYYPVQNLLASDLAQMVAPLVGAEVTTASERQTSRTSTRDTRRRTTSSMRSGLTTPRITRGTMTLDRTNRTDERLRGHTFEVEPLAGTSGPRGASPLLMAQVAEGPTQVAPQPDRAPGPPPPAGPEELTVTAAAVTEAIIAADDNTNILMISAPPEQLELIQGMLERLDVLPPQVHIQAIIADVSLSRNTALGFQWSELKPIGPYGGDGVTLDFSTFFGISTEEDNFGLFGEIAGDQLAGVLQALTTDSNARILAAPSIFTANNLEAEINISQQLPFPTGTFQSTVAAETISTSLEYQSIGIVLRVTPRVTQGGTVQLDIQLEANEPGASVPIAGEEFPSYNQRLAQATLSVKNGHTIVMGGLMREKIERTAQKVPLLGDIPLLGSLFRSRSTERTKSELLLFLTPRIVRNPAEAAAVTESEKSRLWSVPQILRRPADVPAPGVDEWWMPGYEDVGPTDLDEWESYEEDMLQPLEEEQIPPPEEELPATPDAEEAPSVDEEGAAPPESIEELPSHPQPGAGAEAGKTRPEAEEPTQREPEADSRAPDQRPQPA